MKIKDITSPSPVNIESPFKYSELFFSITDPKSTITYANEVFVRISKYKEEEVIGQLHKLIRHPEMPRAVFYEFWNHLEDNRPVAAYVKNLAKDGSYYWVMALAFPCDGGYLSVRLKPGSKLFETVQEIYKEVLNHEKQKETSTDKKTAMHDAHRLFVKKLKQLGFANYDEFMWNALQSEMQHREEILHTSGKQNKTYGTHIPPELLHVESILRELVLALGQLRQIHESLVGHSDYILKLSRSVLLLSMNAQISSSKLDSDDRSIAVVAEKMGEQSLNGETHLVNMQKTIFGLSELIGKLNFNIISSKLQAEMTKNFIEEIEQSETANTDQLISTNKALGLLYDSFIPTLDGIASDLNRLPEFLKKLNDGVREVERFLMVLRFIHIKGKVEIARMNHEGNSFANTFNELINEVNSAEKRLHKLGDIIRKHEKTSALYSSFRGKLNTLGNRLKAYRMEQTDHEELNYVQNIQPEKISTDPNDVPKNEVEKTAILEY